MSFLKYAAGLAVVAVLSACGGGGGNSGATGSDQPLKVAAPTAVTMAPGAAVSYAISGGQKPYSAVSDNSTITQVAVSPDNNLIIGGVLDGAAKVQVRDSKSALVEIAVTVSSGPAVALFTTAPSPVNMAPGTAQSFGIGGGRAPYAVFSDNVSVATVTVSGSVLGIKAIAAGTANLKISDALGAIASVAVTVASNGVPLSVSPTTASVFVDMPVEVVIVGGTPPYRVGGGMPSAVRTVFDVNQPNKLLVTPLLVSSGLDITILDSQDASVKFTVTAIAGQPTIRLSPNALTVAETNRTQITLTVFGATGLISAFSSDLTLLNTTMTGNTITVNQSGCVGADTPVTITVVDANRASATSVITVKDNGNIVDITGALVSKCPS